MVLNSAVLLNRTMKLAGFTGGTLAALFSAATAAAIGASTDDSNGAMEPPYARIAARNIFHLVPVPSASPPPAVEASLPLKLTPKGIMTIFGRVQVLFTMAEESRRGQPVKEHFLVLGEGEREGNVEVIRIDQENSVITFSNHGTIQELPLGRATPGNPGPSVPPGPVADHTGIFGNAAPALGPMGRDSTAAATQQWSQSKAALTDRATMAARNIALIEQNRLATQAAVDQGLLPPLPPTMLTPPGTTAAGGSPLIAPQ